VSTIPSSVRIITLAALAVLAAWLPPATAHAQGAADRAAIRAAALDYIEGWYEGDSARMTRALHPELAKRIVRTDPATGQSRLGQQGARTLIQDTRDGGGRDTPPAQRRRDVTILDVHGGAASAKIVASDWIDYLHLARWNGRWVIVNVLWELTPKSR
jgi:hypothetical protein